MKLILLLILSLIYITVAAADDNTTTTTPKEVKPNTICNQCNCNQKLKTLDCSHLKLQNIFTDDDWKILIASDSSGVIKSIQFNNNNIKNLTELPSSDVEELNLSHNKMETIVNGAFKNLQKLTILDLSNNQLITSTLIPKVFEGNYNAESYEPIISLKILRLSSNNLHSLNIDIFEHFPSLEELYLDLNPFKVIDHSTEVAISGISHLKVLDLSYIEIEDIPIHFFHAPAELIKLNITGNYFTEIPEALEYAVNLVQLTLDENNIEFIDSEHAFPYLPKLETLEFSYIPKLNVIGKGGLSKLTGLKNLDISHNRNLSRIDPQALCNHGQTDAEREEWPPLTVLKLDNNNLTYLDSHLVARWDTLTIIDVHNNPWSCDCDNQWMIDNLIPLMENSSQTNYDKVLCASPIEMKDIHLSELADKHSHLRCLDKFGNRPERDGSVLIGILVGVLIGIPLALGCLWIYKRGCFGLMASGGAGEFSRAYYKRAGNQDDFYI